MPPARNHENSQAQSKDQLGSRQQTGQTEDLLDHLLRAEPVERALLLDALCEAYPQQAEKLRRRYQALEHVGMLEQEDPGQPKQYVSQPGSWSAGIASTSRGGSLAVHLK